MINIDIKSVQSRNYVDSRIMDFSTAWTVPNIRLDRALKWDLKHQIDEADTNDYFMFDDMIEKWNLEHKDMPQSDYRMTQGDKYRPVTNKATGGGAGGKAAPGRRASASSSGSSVELEEIPLLERMRDNRYLVLASSYDWVGRKPAVAQPDVLAPRRPLAPRPSWAPLGFSVPEFPIAGFPLPGSPMPEPDTDTDTDADDTRPPTPWSPGPATGPSTTVPTVPGPSTSGAPPPTPGPTTGPRDSPAGPGSRPPGRSREARKLEAIREAAGGISSACDTLKAMAENIVHIIDDDDNDDDDDSGANNDDASPGTRQQQETARRSGRATRPVSRRRRREDEDDEDGAYGSARPPARRARWEDFDGSLARRLMALSVAGQPDTVERR